VVAFISYPGGWKEIEGKNKMDFDPSYASTTSAPVSTFNDLLNQAEVTKSVQSKKGPTYYVTKKTATSVNLEGEGAKDIEITDKNFEQYFGGRRRARTKRRLQRRKRTMKRLRGRK
jgi:hypothetical protein